MMNEELWAEAWRAVESAVSEVAWELSIANPDLRWRTGYSKPQPVFPFRGYASATADNLADEIEGIEFTVDCQHEGERLRITSDICYPDGRIMAEGPTVLEPEGVHRSAWVHEQFEAAAEFLRSNKAMLRDLIRAAA
ncbi:hypothetical protein [Microlunatus speluncae]|uniref:hypothetical protein n=1 Tax=Microlunatus speluncae TaxID=2594267 RepID=UPI0012664764|nr:hypothetical protein [Microlunatus speluncae]